MKKIIVTILSICFVLCLTACNNGKTTEDIASDVSQISSVENQTDVTDTSSNEQNTDTPTSTTDNNGGSSNTNVSSSTTSKPTTTKPTESKPTHKHEFSAATCTAPQKCSCGETKGSALGHKWQDATCEAPKTCSTCKTTEGATVDHSFDSKGKCKWCKQILPIAPENLNNKEYTIYKPSTDSTEMVDSFSLCFDLGGVSEGEYLTCMEVYGPSCPEPENHFYYQDRNYHCVAGSGLISCTTEKSGNYIVVKIKDYNVILTLELRSNDTLKIVSVFGELHRIKLLVGDIFE